MSPVGQGELIGLTRALRVLRMGGAVVVPNPAPMAYGVVATRAHEVNAIKRRPADQNVAVSLHDRRQWEGLLPSIDLPPTALKAVGALLARRLSVLMPLRGSGAHPPWVSPAVRDGYLAAFNGYWTATACLWQEFPQLYGSSANVTGSGPAASASEARAMFGADCAVVGADRLDGQSGHRSASTMVRIDRTGRLALHRSGAHDTARGLGPDAYLRDLASSVGLA